LPWPEAPPEDYAPVTWTELRAMADAGIEIGAHTRTHCRLTRVGESQLHDELAGTKTRIEAMIDREVVSLCYPNGAPQDYDARVMRAAEQASYRSAVTAHFDGKRGGLFDLRRHGAGIDMHSFRKCLCGVDELSRRIAGAK
jgi:peptidoglycan/xylan/chitin deacetylase (PgdA/CDA1 family)